MFIRDVYLNFDQRNLLIMFFIPYFSEVDKYDNRPQGVVLVVLPAR